MEVSEHNNQGNLLITGAFILGAVLVLSVVVLLAVLVLHPASAPVQTVTNNIGAGQGTVPSSTQNPAPPVSRGPQISAPAAVPVPNPSSFESRPEAPAMRPAPAQPSFDLGRVMVRQNPLSRSSAPLPNRLPGAAVQRGLPLQRGAESVVKPSAAPLAEDVRLNLDHSTESQEWQGLQAPAGFKFLQASFTAANTGNRTVSFQADGAVAEDRDNLGYVANPELNGTWPPQQLAPGQRSSWTSVFLVPQDASLQRLSFALADGRKVSTEISR
jgi:hypothetical protein